MLARRFGPELVTIMLRAYHHCDFPKGIRELVEEPLEASKREVAEVTGLTELSF